MSERDPSLRRTDRAGSEGADLLEELPHLRKPISGETPLADVINPLVRVGELYEPLPNGAVHCYACGHNCRINPGGRGICQVRYNLAGKLYVPWGYVAALQSDPTEKKPFFHVYPGSDTLTFGMLGCDLHCSYCQNWDISQALRDSEAGRPPSRVTPQQLVDLAERSGAKCIASSYNEPLITSEWAAAVFKLGKAAGFACNYVSNGNATPRVLDYLRPYVDGYKIDLKSMNDKTYRKLGGVLQNVLDTVRRAHAMGFWVEIVTLVVPGLNDSDQELREAARFLRSVSPTIPWHVTAFHQDYRMLDHENTNTRTLLRAVETGYAEGLHFVYAGNQPGRVGPYENTRCPHCQHTLVERYGYVILDYDLTPAGTCPQCGASIPGLWPKSKSEVRLGTSADLWGRLPRRVR